MEEFKKANLFFNSKDDIAEAKSHNHDILQCLDVILGAMEFRLNEKHKAKPEGQRTRGKELLPRKNYISSLIKISVKYIRISILEKAQVNLV